MSDIRRNFFRNFRSRAGNLIEFPIIRGGIGGFVLANGTDASHDINIAIGQCRDSTDAFNIVQTATSPFVKQADQPWAAGSAAGGLGTNQIDGAQTVTFNDNGGSEDDVTIDSGTWAVTPEAGDTLIINSSASNDANYQVLSSTTTVTNVATASFTGEATSAATVHLLVDNDTYHIFAIRADASPGAAVDFGFDTSVTAANLLTNSSYTFFRRIGSLRTDAAANWTVFLQNGDIFLLDASVQDISNASTGTGVVTHTLASIPTGIRVEADITIETDRDAAIYNLVGHGDISTLATPTVDLKHWENGAGATVVVAEWVGHMLTNTSSQIKTRSHLEPNNLKINTRGWIDSRGKED